MLLIDTAAGSRDLLDLPTLIAAGAQPCSLKSADVVFAGNGATGPVTIAVEVKAVTELVQALFDGRANGIDGQFYRMADTYDVNWLLYHGLTRRNPSTGALQIGHTKVARGHIYDRVTVEWRDYGDDFKSTDSTTGRRVKVKHRDVKWTFLENFLTSPDFARLGISVKHAVDIDEVAQWLVALYDTWQRPYDQHRAMHTFDQSRDSTLVDIRRRQSIKPISAREMQVAKTAFSLPAVGFERAWALAAVYGQPCPKCGERCTCGATGVRAMVNAGPAVLSEVRVRDGKGKERRVGKVVAQTVEDAIT